MELAGVRSTEGQFYVRMELTFFLPIFGGRRSCLQGKELRGAWRSRLPCRVAKTEARRFPKQKWRKMRHRQIVNVQGSPSSLFAHVLCAFRPPLSVPFPICGCSGVYKYCLCLLRMIVHKHKRMDTALHKLVPALLPWCQAAYGRIGCACQWRASGRE